MTVPTKDAIARFRAAQAAMDATCKVLEDVPDQIVGAYTKAYVDLCSSTVESVGDVASMLGAVLSEVRAGDQFSDVDRTALTRALEFLYGMRVDDPASGGGAPSRMMSARL